MYRSCYSEGELVRLVSWQVGRKPSIKFEVSVKCPFGWPAVLNNSPFNTEGNPNPNLYYLTCPYLRLALARLEDEGLTCELQSAISDNTSLKDDIEKAQEDHDLEWRKAATEAAGRIPSQKMNIAGSGDPSHLKCLHAHFAYYLTHPDYTVGLMISRVLGKTWCDDETCRNWK